MSQPGEIISYQQMCVHEEMSLQRGMNFQVNSSYSIILMSVQENSPYDDEILDDGNILIYEGHDVPSNEAKIPKSANQELLTPSGGLTQNDKFHSAASKFKNGKSADLVKVYQKLRKGIWVYNGVFELIDSWKENTGDRNVYKFKLRVTDLAIDSDKGDATIEPEHNRMIPSHVKLEVWKRDKGKCVQCGANTNLHYDHIIPFSKGGSSLTVENIQLLYAKHNLRKHDKII